MNKKLPAAYIKSLKKKAKELKQSIAKNHEKANSIVHSFAIKYSEGYSKEDIRACFMSSEHKTFYKKENFRWLFEHYFKRRWKLRNNKKKKIMRAKRIPSSEKVIGTIIYVDGLVMKISSENLAELEKQADRLWDDIKNLPHIIGSDLIKWFNNLCTVKPSENILDDLRKAGCPDLATEYGVAFLRQIYIPFGQNILTKSFVNFGSIPASVPRNCPWRNR